MPANSSISLTSLDFDSYKSSLKAFLKQQNLFKDYDYESSNMNVFLDVLAYNTYQNSFYLNMVGNEMFLDSAKIRSSVVSHAKELNYTPRSFRSASANVQVTITSSDATKRNITIPKGTGFSTRVGSNTFIFTTNESTVVTSSNSTFVSSLTIFEGDFVTDAYAVDYETPSSYIISNENVDLSSLKVTVIEDNGSTLLSYSRATSLFDLDDQSNVFFVQAYRDDLYEVIFGDGLFGRQPKNNSSIILEYRVSSGEMPNGARIFRPAENIDNESNISVRALSSAGGGAVYESIESIKYNAPRAFTTQERAVTAGDYENILKENYPEINVVTAFGGQDANPPQYGRIFVSVDLNDIDGMPASKIDEYTRFLRTRSTVSMEPIFINPEYVYIEAISKIKYNINTSTLNPEDIRTIAMSSMLTYASTNLNKFAATFRYSKFIETIDNSDTSIISNDTDIRLVKYATPVLNAIQKFVVSFNTELADISSFSPAEHPSLDYHTISSSNFIYDGRVCNIEDNGDGVLGIVTTIGQNHKLIVNCGTVDYLTGKININNLKISSFSGAYLKFYAVTKSKDISSTKNTILNIRESDLKVTIEQVRE